MNNPERHLVVFPDTNVLVQGLPLQDLPWRELGRAQIEVVICGPVIRELDRLKNKPGRVGRVARTMSGTVRKPMTSPDRSDVLREGDPRVRRCLSRGAAGGTAVREGLDVSHDDQAIINQALSCQDGGDDVILLTDDNFAAMTAEHFGLRAVMLPAHWLKPAEGDESTKEIARLQAENSRLKSTQPVAKLRFVDEFGKPIDRLEATIKCYPPVADHQIERLMARVLAAAPMVDLTLNDAARHDPASTSSIAGQALVASAMRTVMRDYVCPVTQVDIDEYANAYRAWSEAVRAKLVGFNNAWNLDRDLPRATLLALNAGSRPAEDVLIELAASGPFQVSGYGDGASDRRSRPGLTLALPEPPPPPRRKPLMARYHATLASRQLPLVRSLPSLTSLQTRRKDDAFYWRAGKKTPVETMELECTTWRHGRGEEPFNFRMCADDGQDIAGLVIGRASASNLSKPIEVRLPVRISFAQGDSLRLLEQLVEMFERHRR